MNELHTNHPMKKDEQVEQEGIASTTAAAAITATTSTVASACPYAAALNWNSDSDSITTTGSTNMNHPDLYSNIPKSFRLHHDDDATTTASPTSTSTKQMIQSCPAFQNGHCPFASCTNEHEIRKMLLQIPSSHYQHTTGSNNQEDATYQDDADLTRDREHDLHPNHSSITSSKNHHDPETTPFLKVLQDLHAVAGTIATTTTSSGTNTATGSTTTIPIPNKCPVFHATSTMTTHHPSTVTTTSKKFTHVIMDGYSLSEIMARLAKQIEEEEEEEGNVDGETTRIPSTTETETTAFEGTMPKHPLEDSASIAVGSTENTQRNAVPTTTSTSATEADARKLSVTMKSGTAASHVAAENVYFVRNFIRGQIDPTLFAALTKQLFYVYRTLEYHLLDSSPSRPDRESRVHVEQFQKFHQALQRTESLKEDLDYWFGTKEAQVMIQYDLSNDDSDSTNHHKFISPATKDYIQRIQYCAQHSPYLLLAHSYTRYLGDLSGGKILARVARKALQLSSTDDGLAFYDFAATISNTKQFKDEYRLALDQLEPPLTSEQIQLLVAEANIAFVLNMRIFEELDVMANIPNATVRPYEEAIRPYVIIPGSDNTPKADVDQSRKKEIPKECPFAKMNTVSSSSNPHGDSGRDDDAHSTMTTAKSSSAHSRCPWPFILFHDPQQFIYDWQTWMALGLLLCWVYHQFVIVES